MSLLAQQFRQQVSKSKDFRMKNEEEFPVGYSTGFLGFDFINGTVVHTKVNGQPIQYYSVGITDGSMNMFIGRSGCGKTTLAIQIAGNIIRPFKTSCIFHDNIEGGVNDARKESLTKMDGEVLHSRYISRNTGITAENFYERVKMIHDLKMEKREDFEYDTQLYDTKGERIYKLEPTIYLMDSLALLMPDKYTEEDGISGQMSATAAAKMNSMLFKRVVPMLKSANIILLVINHVNDNVSINPMDMKQAQVGYLKQSETIPGGKVPVYLSNNLIRVADHSKLKSTEGFGIDGNLVDVTLIKSRSARAGKSVTLVYDPVRGFDAELSLLQLLKANKRINGAGAHLYVGEFSDVKFSQKQFKNKLHTVPEFRQAFMAEVQDVLVSLIENDVAEDTTDMSEDMSTDILSGLTSITA